MNVPNWLVMEKGSEVRVVRGLYHNWNDAHALTETVKQEDGYLGEVEVRDIGAHADDWLYFDAFCSFCNRIVWLLEEQAYGWDIPVSEAEKIVSKIIPELFPLFGVRYIFDDFDVMSFDDACEKWIERNIKEFEASETE